jgi:hypothetical protein
MAQELTLNLTMGFSKNNISNTMTSGTQKFDVAGSDYVRETWSVPTAVTAIPVSAITTPGYFMVTNRDDTNFVDVYSSAAGAACVRIKPGEWAVFRFAGTTPAMKADTAPVKVEFSLLAD